MVSNARVLFLSHGGGPLPLLNDPGHVEMVDCLQRIARQIERPKAIIVFSAHWETACASVTSGRTPELIYDYDGFPEESYSVAYPCPGSPTLATQVFDTLIAAGIDAELNPSRGFDHGLFVPLKIMYPDAEIPCLQISLMNSLNPADHIDVGASLSALLDEDTLVIGSGFSFHNMRAFFSPNSIETKALNQNFEDWLHDTCTNDSITENERRDRLINWSKAPGARYCHPREEHLLPLHACLGLAGRAANEAFQLEIMQKKASMYLW